MQQPAPCTLPCVPRFNRRLREGAPRPLTKENGNTLSIAAN